MKKLLSILLFIPCFCLAQRIISYNESKYEYYDNLYLGAEDSLKNYKFNDLIKEVNCFFRQRDYLDSAKKYWNLWYDENIMNMKETLQLIELKTDLEKLRLPLYTASYDSLGNIYFK